MEKRTASGITGAALALLFAVAQFRLVIFVFGIHYARSVDAARGVLDGHPHWRVFQNRVLGPYMVKLLSAVFPSFDLAHVFFSIAAIAMAGFLAWRLGRRHGGDLRSALLALLVFEAAFACLLSPPWLYAWDYLDIIVFLLFVDLVLSRARTAFFVALFCAAALNRESCLFIALWMMIDPLVGWSLGRAGLSGRERMKWPRFCSGAACAVLGIVVTEALRRALLVEEIGFKLFGDTRMPRGAGFVFNLGDNISALVSGFSGFDLGMPFFLPLFIALCVILAILMVKKDPARCLSLALMELAMIAALLCFTLATEVRVYLELVPFIVAAVVVLAGRSESAAVSS